MNTLALNNISYGLFVLTASDAQSTLNACILNTAMQVTISPNAIAVAVNKSNLTHDMVASSKEFTISIISEKADFEMFKRFGLQSGRDVDKFCDYPYIAKNSLGAAYITEHTNAYVHGKVKEIVDLGTHSLFIADVLDADILSDDPSMTYDYYHKNVKPAPAVSATEGNDNEETSTGKWVCKICNYVYEGDELPQDFICPWCKHPASDFERVTE